MHAFAKPALICHDTQYALLPADAYQLSPSAVK